MDLMKLRYGYELPLPDTNEPTRTTSDMFSYISTQTIFVALEGNTINLWVLGNGEEVHFRQKEMDGDTFLPRLMENIQTVPCSSVDKNSLHFLYDTVIGPVADLLQGDELIIVPDGPLCIAPYTAFIDCDSR